MMTGAEIQAFADEWSLSPAAAERDYLTGWLAAGIADHDRLGPAWTFTGGACLRKCFLETYRFPGELAFTVSSPTAMDPAQVTEALVEVARWVRTRAGLEIPQTLIQCELGRNGQGDTIGRAYVHFRGPLTPDTIRTPSLEEVRLARARALRAAEQHPNLHALAEPPAGFVATTDPLDGYRIDYGLPFIVIRFAAEPLVRHRVARRLAHPYSDAMVGGFVIPCPPLEELFCERLLTLATHPRPGDLFDLVAMFRHEQARPPIESVRYLLSQKPAAKRLGGPGAWRLTMLEKELRESWEPRLARELPAVPPFDQVWTTVPAILQWLETGVVDAGPGPIPFGEEFRPFLLAPDQPRAARMKRSPYVEIIRYALVNRLCLRIDYENASGEIASRMVEPYALRASRRGDVLLMATHRDVRNLRSYRLDRMRGVRVTATPFTARYAGDPGPVLDPPLQQYAGAGAAAGAGSSRR